MSMCMYVKVTYLEIEAVTPPNKRKLSKCESFKFQSFSILQIKVCNKIR